MHEEKNTLPIFHRPSKARRHLPFDSSGYNNIWSEASTAVIFIYLE